MLQVASSWTSRKNCYFVFSTSLLQPSIPRATSGETPISSVVISLSFLTAHVLDWYFTKSLLRTRQSLHLINLQASDCVEILNHPTLVCVVAVEDFLVAFNI